jgi:hypothetical protein
VSRARGYVSVKASDLGTGVPFFASSEGLLLSRSFSSLRRRPSSLASSFFASSRFSRFTVPSLLSSLREPFFGASLTSSCLPSSFLSFLIVGVRLPGSFRSNLGVSPAGRRHTTANKASAGRKLTCKQKRVEGKGHLGEERLSGARVLAADLLESLAGEGRSELDCCAQSETYLGLDLELLRGRGSDLWRVSEEKREEDGGGGSSGEGLEGELPW